MSGRIIVLSVMCVIVAGCSDARDGGPTLQEYFQKVELAQKDVAVRADDVTAATLGGLDEDGSITDDERESLESWVEQTDDVFSDFISDLEDIEAPDELKNEHQAYIAAYTQFKEALAQSFSDLHGVESEDDVGALFVAIEEPFVRAGEACARVRAIAKDNQIDVDLTCRGAALEPPDEPLPTAPRSR